MRDPGRSRARRNPAPWMTVKLKSGEERLKKPNKRAPEAEEEEEAAGEGEEKSIKEGNIPLPEIPSQDPEHVLTPSEPLNLQQDQRHFLRSSVRPHTKRLRKDSCSDGAGTSAKTKGLDSATPSSPSCSTGLAPNAPKASSRNLAPSGAEKEEGSKKKVRRQWESWSTEDKNTFFEALYEHGKDFEAIQNNIALKYKKKAKPASMVKNKEQVRHFYYRTWHKISKYIDFNNVFSRGLKKSSQELYGLICYGELRKKIGGCMDDKNATKLNELIQLGVTTVRYKGRNLRIKAPMCRALKKLCDPDGKTGLSDEEDQKPVRLPLKVPVELQPRNNQAWARVQSLAQNPRLRMIVELHRKVSSLIEFLKQKWALKEVRIRKTLEDHQLKELGPQESEDELFLFPTEAAQLSSLPGVARVVHSKAYCTVHWQETGKCKQSIKDTHLLPPAQILGIQTGQGTARVQLKCLKGGADGNKGSKVNGGTDALPYRTQVAEDGFVENAVSTGVSLSPKTPDESPPEHVDSPADAPYEGSGSRQPDVEELSLLDPFPRYLKSCQDLIIPEENDCTDKALDISPTSPETLHSGTMEVSPGQRDTEPQTTAGGPADTCTTETSGTESQEKEQCDPSKPSQDSANQFIEQLRQVGWNQRTSENLTLAEVYLMLGKPGKLQLEYEWLAPSSSDGSGHTTCHKQRLLNCLLRLISTEVNHKTSLQAPETTSVATSPMKLPVQDQTLTPPGKVITLLSRNPSCLQSQLTPQIHSHFPSTSSTPGFRNLPRPLLVGNPLGSVTSTTDGGVFAVPTMRPPNSRHSKVSSPGKESGSPVRQPLDAISSEFFLPKSKKPRSRHPRKPLVVQRTLLPRPSGSSSHNVCSFSILSNSSVAGRGSFRPIHTSLGSTSVSHIVPKGLPTTNPLSSAIDLAAKTAGIIPGGTVPVVDTEGLSGITPLPPDGLTGTSQTAASQSTSTDSIPSVTVSAEDPIPFMALSTTPVQESRQSFQPSAALSLPELSQNSLQNGPSNASTCTPSSAGSCLSPPNVSALLDISLPGPPDDVLSHGGTSTHISDSIIEIAISSGQFGEAVPLSPAKLNDSSKSLPSPNSSPQQNWIASPSHDPQWYPNDSTDSSLSSLFSSFISPEKGRKTLPTAPGSTSGTSLLGPSLLDGSSRDSFVSRTLDVTEVVDSQLACLMNENSIDYISRFNDLAQELSATEPTRREVPFESGAPASGQPIRDLS
ncbi:protein cramped-like isoform X2 [Xenopus tropicalis]|uniref:Protein cramped-like n=1 Tax=Xenopus tropicalis TaxID=8364 RepID=A0A8J0R537_XENTR|nr:protein cramped-like isoform X2 [Xenopus tropicalis]|eukprot:XP_004918071.1 PREDICTED: protein cramped-like isoform X2 [Xenopus tropicalis]